MPDTFQISRRSFLKRASITAAATGLPLWFLRKDPITQVENAHRSAVVGHLIIIAMQLGRKLQWEPAKEIFTGDGAKEANPHLAREMRKPYDYSFVG